jgi:hypothetical protein
MSKEFNFIKLVGDAHPTTAEGVLAGIQGPLFEVRVKFLRGRMISRLPS